MSDATPTVTVRGEAAIPTEPDEAIVWVTLTARDAAPGPALANVSARHNALVEMLDGLGVAKSDRSTTGITVYEDFDHTHQGRRSLGHCAESAVSVRLTDADAIGELVARATSALDARIAGPRWQIAPDNPVRLEAARAASADARRRAQAFADGVGATLGRLIRLAEGERHGIVHPMGGVWRAGAAAAPMDVEPGEHEVTASIEATFALELG
jgi:uncharacterized protein YggE